MITTESTPAQVLLAAADHLERVGWVQGMSFGGGRYATARFTLAELRTQPCCVIGALQAVTGRVFANGSTAEQVAACRSMWPLFEKVQYTLKRALGGCRLADWNDDPAQTAACVIATLRLVASHE